MKRNLKRLFRILKGHYHLLVLSIILIIIIQGLNFVSPLIVKKILDDCILGIEYSWVEVTDSDEYTVSYNNKFYKQKRNLDEDDNVISNASIVINGGAFYFIEDEVIDGKKELNDNNLTISNKNESKTYSVIRLSKDEIKDFYHPSLKMLYFFIILLFIKSILVIIFAYLHRITNAKVMTILARNGRTIAMKHVETLPISYFEEEPAGKMASRITKDVDGFIIMYNQLSNTIISATLSFILAYVGMFMLDYRLALMSFIVYPLAYIWIKFFLKYLKKIAEKVNELRSLLTAKINEIINGINILQIFNFKKQTIKEFNEINENYKNEQLKEVKLHITLGWNMIFCVRSLITTLVILYFGLENLNFASITISAGLIYAYNEYLLKITDPISIVFNQISDFEHSQVQLERIHKIIEGEDDEASSIYKDMENVQIERYKGNIKFDNVWFSYVDKEYVLKGVSFDIKAGQLVGLVGHTGSGKTSLMNLLLRFYDLNDELSGNIYVDGIDIKTYPKKIYRQGIGIVLQEPVMFKGDIASNIRFGKDVSDEEIERILDSLGAHKFISKFEKGIHQEINRAGINISSGEKQLISLARALVHNPSILIMDEATSHIDTETEEMIKSALKEVCKNRTVIVIAHRLSTIYNADKIIVLDHGLKVEEGTHKELLSQNGVYANIYRAQIASKNIYK